MEATKPCPFCGEPILTVAIRCKHCHADLNAGATQAAAKAPARADYAWAMVGIPIAATALLWLWVAGLPLILGPGRLLVLIVIGVVVLTAAIAAIEASKLGMTSDRARGTYSPTEWCLTILLLWVIGYPAYLFGRRKFGVQSQLLPGLFAMAIFLCSAAVLSSAIDAKTAEVTGEMQKAMQELQRLTPPSNS